MSVLLWNHIRLFFRLNDLHYNIHVILSNPLCIASKILKNNSLDSKTGIGKTGTGNSFHKIKLPTFCDTLCTRAVGP